MFWTRPGPLTPFARHHPLIVFHFIVINFLVTNIATMAISTMVHFAFPTHPIYTFFTFFKCIRAMPHHKLFCHAASIRTHQTLPLSRSVFVPLPFFTPFLFTLQNIVTVQLAQRRTQTGAPRYCMPLTSFIFSLSVPILF